MEGARRTDRAGWPILARLLLLKVRVALCLHLGGALYRQGLQRRTLCKVLAGQHFLLLSIQYTQY